MIPVNEKDPTRSTRILPSNRGNHASRRITQSSFRSWIVVSGLALLAFAGYFKASPAFSWIPFDPAAIGAGIIAIAVIFRAILQVSGSLLGFPTILFLIVALTLGIPFEEWTPYTFDKVLRVVSLVPLSILGGALVLRRDSDRYRWLAINALLGIAVVGLALIFPSEDTLASSRLALEGSNTIGAGRAAGATVVILGILSIAGTRHRVLFGILAFALLVATVATGSRGPLFAAIVSVFVVIAFSPGKSRGTRVLFGASAMLGSVLLAINSGIASTRLLTLSDDSAQVRLDLWRAAIEGIISAPLGVGWSHYQALLPTGIGITGWEHYPHNLLLEITLEAGWIAGIAFLVAVATAIFRQRRATIDNPAEMAMLGLLVFHLANSMVSGDVTANRGLWVAIGAALILSRPVPDTSK